MNSAWPCRVAGQVDALLDHVFDLLDLLLQGGAEEVRTGLHDV
jgi:hypothetical protein